MSKLAILNAWLTGLLLLLVLAACGAATATPEVVIPGSRTQSPATAEVSLTAVPSAAPPATETAARPTDTPPSPTPVAAPRSELPFPALLRTLNFGIPAGNSYWPGAMAVHPGLERLYVLTLDNSSCGRQHGLVTVLDLASGEILAVAETGLADSINNRALAVDTLRDRVYAYNDQDKTCTVLDAASLEPVATIEAVLSFGLDRAGGRLYVAGPNGLRVLDVADYQVFRQNEIPFSAIVFDMAVDPARGRIYVAHLEEGSSVLDQYDTGTLRKVASTVCQGGCRAVLPDPARDRVYLTVGDDADSLWAVDDLGKRLERLRLGEPGSYRALALDAAGDRLFAARDSWSKWGIAVIDLKTGKQVGAIALASGVNGLVWDSERSRLWLSLGDRVAVADPATGQVAATGPLAIDLTPPASLVAGGGRLYLTDSTGTLHILDTATYEELAALPSSGKLMLEPALNRLYVTSEESVTVVDTAALTVTKVLTPGGSVAWDPKRNRLYVGGFTGSGQVYDALTLERLREMPIGGKVVYDPLRDELLVVALTVYRADPETLELLGDLLPDISAGERSCSGCTGVAYAYDAQVQADLNRLVVSIDHHGGGAGCGPNRRTFDATTLEPVDLAARPWEPTCNSKRDMPEAIRNRVYQGLWCGRGDSYRNLFIYDLQGRQLAWRDGVDAGLINPNTCQSYLDGYAEVRVLDLPTLTLAGDLPKGTYTLDAAGGRLYGQSGPLLRVYAEAGGRPDPQARPAEAGSLPAERIVWLEASPDYRHDQILFAGLVSQGQYTESFNEVYRSADGGATWVRLLGGLPEDDYVGLGLAVSPGFAADKTLFAGGHRPSWEGEGVWRSTDGGDTWQPMWDGLAHLQVRSIALSPQYADDGTLLAYSEHHDLLHYTDSHASVSRSTDRGLNWTLVATGTVPPPDELLPPDPRSPGLRFRSGFLGWWVDRWIAEVGAWQPVFRVLGEGNSVRAVLPSPDVDADGTVYVLSQAGLFRSTDRGEGWARCPEGRLDGRDYDNRVMAGCWAGDQIAAGTANGEILFFDPAALQCEPIEAVPPWPAVLAGLYVGEIAAEPRASAGGNLAAGVWLAKAWADGLYRYAGGAIQARYTADDGLPSALRTMAITPGGMVWVGGRGDPNVAAFDGQTWTPYPLPLSKTDQGVLELAAGPDGTVWVVTDPLGVFRWTGAVWEPVEDPQGRLGGRVYAIAIAPDGSPWVATDRGLAHYARGAWTAYDMGACAAVAVGPGGEVVGHAGAGLIWRFAEGVWTTLPSPGPEYLGTAPLLVARDGSVWIGSGQGAFRYDGQAWRQFAEESGLPDNTVEVIAEDSDSGLWFGTANGAARVNAEELDLSPVSWLPPVPVPFPTVEVTASPTPWPSATPLPVPEAPPAAGPFAEAYADPWLAAQLRLPREEASVTQAALQRFEHGLMIWRGDTKQIYVLHDDGSLGYYNDTWDESQPLDDPARVPPDGLYQPLRGFGKPWRTEVGLASKLGWALAPEQAYEMLVQPFEGGTMLLGPQGEIYVLLPFWTWERR